MWTMHFDGSTMQESFGAGCVLIDPLQRKHLISSRLEFEWTNNTVNYEALILGLQNSIHPNTTILKVVGVL